MWWSASRLNDIAAVRAATIASPTQSHVGAAGHPGDDALIMEITANGRAKIVCLNAIISPVSRMLATTREATPVIPAI